MAVAARRQIPLVAPSYDASDVAAVQAAAAGCAFDQGAIVAEFERAMAQRLGMAGGVATTSGTAALHLTLLALGVKRGERVILPSYTCVALLHALRLVGAQPVLIDNAVDRPRMDYNADATGLVPRRETSRTPRVTIVPHAFGVPVVWSRLPTIKGKVIEDVTMALGATWDDGQPAGSIGDLTVCSFHASKLLSTGAGGLVLGRNAEMVERLRDLNSGATGQVTDRLAAPELVWGKYEPRSNYQMTDTVAALGLSQLARLDTFLARRAEIAARYNDALRSFPVGLPLDLPDGAVYFRYLMDVSLSGRSVPEVLRALAEHGVEGGRGVYPALHQLLGVPGWERTNAQQCTERLVSLPVHPALSDEDVETVIAAAQCALVGDVE